MAAKDSLTIQANGQTITVSIHDDGGGITTRAFINGTPTSFPQTITSDTTYTFTDGAYTISCLIDGIECYGQTLTFGNGESESIAPALSAAGLAQFDASGGGGTQLPSQTGNSGKVLATNGSALSWNDLSTTYAPSLGPFTKTPLVVDGVLLREGTGGPRYRATGYNINVTPNIYQASQTLTATQLDKYFSQLRPNSLSRFRCYAPPSGSGITWTQQLAWFDTVVATARKYGQRLIACLTGWGSIDQTADAFQPKATSFVTGQVYLASVTTGGASFQDWVNAVVPRYKNDGTVCIYDICNEPLDAGGSNTTAFKTWFETTRGWIQAIDPAALVYVGIDTAPDIGGTTPYETVNTNMDLCSAHIYSNYGFANVDTGAGAGARVLGKPYIVDEIGVWSGPAIGAGTADPVTGLVAVSPEAQGRMMKETMLRMFSQNECCAILPYSYMDSDGGGYTDGGNHYEPINQSLTRKAIKDVDLNGDPFSIDTISTLANASHSWIDGVQAFRWTPGAAITSVVERASTNAYSQSAGPLSGSWNGHGTLQFTGSQYVTIGAWKVWNPQQTYICAFVPLSNPASSNWYYLIAPQGVGTNGGIAVRINSSGQIEVTNSAITATPAPSQDVVKATSTNSVIVSDVNTLAVTWNASSSTSNGYAAGALSIVLNGVETTASQQKTFTGLNGKLGAAYDNSMGFVGHWLQGFSENIAESKTNRAMALAYLMRKYVVAA